jgi:hypothetical protein
MTGALLLLPIRKPNASRPQTLDYLDMGKIQRGIGKYLGTQTYV